MFYTGGGLLCVSAFALPQGPDTHVAGIGTIGLVALVTAAALRTWSARVPGWLFHGVVLAGNVLITLVVVLAGAGVPATTWAMMYVWAPVHTAAFCRRREFVAHFASTIVLHGVALLLLGEDVAALTRILLVAATALVAASVVGSLVVRVRQLAATDALTGLANRRTFVESLDREHALAQRRGRALAVAVLDLDGFKQLNDRHGHAHGDEVLSRVAAAWRARLRRGDLLARVGGDEFALILPDCSLGDAKRLCAQLIDATPDVVGASAGVTVLGADQTAGDALAAADAALYASKRQGGGTVGVSDRPVPAA